VSTERALLQPTCAQIAISQHEITENAVILAELANCSQHARSHTPACLQPVLYQWIFQPSVSRCLPSLSVSLSLSRCAAVSLSLSCTLVVLLVPRLPAAHHQ
jgi:hypothetical protein